MQIPFALPLSGPFGFRGFFHGTRILLQNLNGGKTEVNYIDSRQARVECGWPARWFLRYFLPWIKVRTPMPSGASREKLSPWIQAGFVCEST